MKRLFALITIASLSLGTATLVFADDAPGAQTPDAATEVPAEGQEGEVDEPADPAEVPAEGAETPAEGTETPAAEVEVAPAVEPVPLKYVDSSIYNIYGQVVGSYVKLLNNEKLSKEMHDVGYFKYQVIEEEYSESLSNQYGINYITYDMEVQPTAVKISIEYNFPKAGNVKELETTVIGIYYVDTITSKQITEAEYEALIAPEVVETEEPEVPEVETPEVEVPVIPAEPVLVPIRATAEALGYEVLWNENGSLVITDGTNSASLVIGQNAYTTFTGETVQLDAAPALIDGSTVVTVQFFSEILGATVTFGADGVPVITAAPAVEAPAEGGETPAEGEEEAPADGEEVPAEGDEAPADGEEEAPADTTPVA